jgi:acyl carrier protein
MPRNPAMPTSKKPCEGSAPSTATTLPTAFSVAEIEAEVREIVATAAGVAPDQVRSTSHLVNDLGCDSLTIMEIAMEIEEQFDISVPDEFSDQYPTVGRIVEGIALLLQRPREPS